MCPNYWLLQDTYFKYNVADFRQSIKKRYTDIHVWFKHESKDSWSGYVNIRKTTSRAKKITRGKEIHYIKGKWPIHKEDITILHVYAPSSKTSNCDKTEGRSKKIHNFIQKLPTFHSHNQWKSPVPDSFIAKSHQTLKEKNSIT